MTVLDNDIVYVALDGGEEKILTVFEKLEVGDYFLSTVPSGFIGVFSLKYKVKEGWYHIVTKSGTVDGWAYAEPRLQVWRIAPPDRWIITQGTVDS
jgi:hypothetical protein